MELVVLSVAAFVMLSVFPVCVGCVFFRRARSKPNWIEADLHARADEAVYGGTAFHTRYSYVVDGKEYYGTRRFGLGSSIFFDPRHPSWHDVTRNTAGEWLRGFASISFGLVVGLAFLNSMFNQ